MTPRRVLVVITRRLGDVLLATPVFRSLKARWPEAAVEALVFSGTEGILAGNPDLARVLTVPERPRVFEHLRFHGSLARRYDLGLSLLGGDRPTLYACVAGRFSAGLQAADARARWKRALLDRCVPFDDLDTHTVRMNLALLQALGVSPVADVVVSWRAADVEHVAALTGGLTSGPYAVVHPCAKYEYKSWHLAGWQGVGEWLLSRGYTLLLTGGADAKEVAYAAALAARLGRGTYSLAGRMSLGALGCVLSGAGVYVGPDTAVTHMAAALGVPTVALFGPSNPVKWGPWPRGHDVDRNPWQRVGTQRQGNVTLVQGPAPCVPCMLEGCERHVESHSDCLRRLAAHSVIDALERMIATAATA